MNNIIKRVICILSIGLIIFSNFLNTVYVFAEVDNMIEDNSQKKYEYYYRVGSILEYFGCEHDEIYCSQLLEIVSDKEIDQTAFFIFNQDDVIGLMEITETESGEMCTFIYDDFDDLGENINNGENVVLVNTEEQLVCVVDDNMEVLIENTTTNKEIVLDNVTDLIDKQAIEQLEIEKEKLPNDVEYEISNVYLTEEVADEENNNTSEWNNIIIGSSYSKDRYHSAYYMLGLPYVPNDTSDNNRGLCWAASGASIANYLKRSTYTARSIYNNLKKKYNAEPVGTTDWEKKCMDF